MVQGLKGTKPRGKYNLALSAAGSLARYGAEGSRTAVYEASTVYSALHAYTLAL